MTMPPDPTLGIICNRSAAPSVAVDNDLSCYWKACTQQFSTPELLYEHLCEWHVGRKTTNNLHLTCQWGLCRTATVRRDRMASHMLVHVPLRPHECKDCGKCFKRPQDLKKHVKSHADPMVLVQPPEEPLGGHNYRQLSRNGSATYHDQGNQVQIDDTASSYQAGQPSGYYAPQPSTSCGLYFIRSAVNNAHVGHSGYSAEAGRSDYMCTLGLIDNSFGDAKCRQIDASSHAQIDRFPMPLNGSFSNSNGPTAASDPNISQQADMTIVRGDPNQSRNSPKQQYYPPAAYMQEDLTRFE